MISAVAAAGPVKAAAVWASVVVAAVGGDGRGRGRGNERKTYTNNIDITTLTGISPRTSGDALGLCAHMSCSYKTAAVVAAKEATRVTKGGTRIELPAV